MKIPSIKALVPMKHDSERVPGKNHRLLLGKPLFHWILESLSDSKYIDEIIVNTDSKLIEQESARYSKVTTLWRPDFLRGKVGIRALIEYDLKHSQGEYYLQTHCTNPLLKSETIDNAIETFFTQSCHDSLFSVTPLHARFYWPDGNAVNHDPDSPNLRTQDLRPIYEENSCTYIFSRSMFDRRRHRLGENPFLFPIDPYEAIDIDEEFDFKLAEVLMKERLRLKEYKSRK